MRCNDLMGLKFGRLTVISRNGSNRRGRALWLCRCSCGTEINASADHLQAAHTRSCGCFDHDRIVAQNFLHGAAERGKRTPEFNAWINMIQRCTNPRRKDWKNYGGRGISVCERWRTFANFFADMGPRPQGMTVDRENNSGNYEPNNCRWATREQQRANRRDSL